MSYADFIQRKSQVGGESGFAPIWMPEFLFPFQTALVEWAIKKGRAAIFADCGLGKTPMQLVWAENIVRHTNKPVLIITPLAVSHQTAREADKFGIDCRVSRDGKIHPNLTVTNYEKLHLFNPNDFAGAVCDESSAIKNFDANRTAAVTEFMRTLRYRLLCTATAAPNDYIELGTTSEALGEMGFQDMISKFFKKQTSKDHLGWGRTTYKMRGHAERDFWRWVCSWARAVRKPSDLGFEDGDFILPPLTVRQTIVSAMIKKPGHLFDVPAETLEEQREERRRTMPERCQAAADLANGTDKPVIVWCHLNPEGDLLEKLIPGSVQVSGNDSDDDKEEAFLRFVSGDCRVLVTKPVIGAFGLNFQHCARQTFFPSHSFEQFYQGVRRSWRFGQRNPVEIDVVTSEGESNVLANLQRKAAQSEEMFAKLVELMNDHLRIRKSSGFPMRANAPAWLAPSITSAGAAASGSPR